MSSDNHYKEAFHELNDWLRENYPGVHKHMLRDSITKNNQKHSTDLMDIFTETEASVARFKDQ